MLAILLLALMPHDAALTQEHDALHINRYWAGGKEQWQIGGCDWDGRGYRWQWWKRPTGVSIDTYRGVTTARWWDMGQRREVRAPVLLRTMTTWDVEVWDRRHLPRNRRRGLREGRR